MEYNVNRKKLEIREYGRNIQKMVDYALEIEDRQKRNIFAQIIIKTMSQVNPNKEMADYHHTLWDHLHIMANYQLDVDSPYPKPKMEEQTSKPEKIAYKNSKIRFRPYGKNIENMIDKVIEMPEGEEKQTLIEMIAQQLKKSYNLFSTSHTEKSKQDNTIVRVVPTFNADSAYQYVKAQCDFGPRVPGSEAHSACLAYFVEQFNAFGADTVIVQEGELQI